MSWTPPTLDGGADIKWYVIKVLNTSDGTIVVTYSQYGSDRSRYISGISIANYNYSVQAVNDPGYSPPYYLLASTSINFVASSYIGSGPWYSSSINNVYATFIEGENTKNERGNGIVFDGSTYWTLPYITGLTYIIWYRSTGNTTGGLLTQTQSVAGANIDVSFNGGPGSVQGYTILATEFGTFLVNVGASGIPGTWNQYTLTYGYTTSMYLNGVLVSSFAPSGRGTDNLPYYIGRTGYTPTATYLVGEIGQIRVEDAFYNQSQITAEYNDNVDAYKTVLTVTMAQLPFGTSSVTASWTLVRPYDVYVQFYSTIDGIVPLTGGTPYGPPHLVLAGTTTYTYIPPSPPTFGTYYYAGVVTVIIPGDVQIRATAALAIQGTLISLVASSYSGSGPWLDTSSFGRNATLQEGTIALNAAQNGIVFDGSTSWTFSTLRSQLQYTMSVWFKATGTSGTGAAIFGETFTPNGQLCMYIVQNTAGPGNTFFPGLLYPYTNRWGNGYTFPLDIWQSMTVSWDGTNMITYINGISIGSTTLNQSPTSASANNNPYRIGGDLDGSTFGYDTFIVGELGEIVVYNYPLSASQVLAHYATTAPDYILLTSVSIVPIQTGDTTLSSSWTMVAPHDVYVQYYSNIDGIVPSSGGTTVGSQQLVSSGTTVNTFSPPGGVILGTYYYVGVVSTEPNSDELRSPYGVALPQVLVNLVAATYSGSGTWYDTSGTGRDATISAGNILVNGDGNGIGLGYEVNGAPGGEWSFPALRSVSIWTMSIWFYKTREIFGFLLMYESGDGYGPMSIRDDPAGFSVTTVGAVGISRGTYVTLTQNVWTSMTVTWDGTNLVTYIDGAVVGTVAYPGIISRSNTNSQYILGTNNGGADFAGYIGEVYILNYPLTATDVTAHYNSTKATYGY
jgi:hypothetical protein